MDFKPTNREVRIANVKRVLHALLRQGPLTLQEITARLELSHATVSGIIRELTESGLVTRGDTLQSMAGRPPTYLSLLPEARYAAGLSVSPEQVRIVLINLSLQVVASQSHPRRLEQTAEYWQGVSGLLEAFLAEQAVDPERLLGVGLSIQAPIENERDIVLPVGTREIAYWDLELVKRSFVQPVSVYNDAKMAAFSHIFGTGEQNDVVYLMLSSGVGGAIIVAGRVLNKERKNAEFGHLTVQDGGRPCTCGQRGCLGSYCSASALRQRSGVDLDSFFEALSRGDAAFAALWEEYLDYLAIGINNLRLIFDTDVIIGGEMSRYLKEYEGPLKERLSRRNPFAEGGDYLHIGKYGAFDSAIGAAMIALTSLF